MASGTTMQEPPRHSRRVEAWIHTVLNPLIESLRREVFYLGKGNLTWRSYSRHCESIRPIVEYLELAYLPNYEDFLADVLNVGFAPKFEAHDARLSHAETTANDFYKHLMQSEDFQNRVRNSLKEYESAAKAIPRYPGLGPVDKNLPRFVAEFIINRTDFLPDGYTMHTFWEDSKRQFESLTEKTEAGRNSPSFQAVEQACGDLREHVVALLRDLESHRQRLSTDYDIPFAPSPSIRIQ